MYRVDVTKEVETGDPDGEMLPIRKCICGKQFGYWEQVICTDALDPWECPECHRKFFFLNNVSVYEVKEEGTDGKPA